MKILTMGNYSMPLLGTARSNKRERLSTFSTKHNKVILKVWMLWLLEVRRSYSVKFPQF
jgi:hypothetical protein